MEKSKTYKNVWFNPEVIKEAYEIFNKYLDDEQKKNIYQSLVIRISETEGWHYDVDEEFFADYRRYSWNTKESICSKFVGEYHFDIHFTSYYGRNTRITIEAPKRQQIEAVFEIFEKYLLDSKLPKPEPQKPVVFIGHGQSEQWKELKDHLHDKHKYGVEAYEVGARAGHEIRDILEDMLERSSFAILVMTGEDRDVEGKLHPRDNVIHELGLFQGKLGFSKAIVLLEESTEEFSNIQGIHQIRYSKGNIKETFGEVLATIKREFEDLKE